MKSISDVTPHEDYGFFGPDSMTWRVWGYPTGLTTGFQRAVVVEELDPFLLAAVNFRQGIYSNPRLRYDRTIQYFATVAFADTRTVIKASQQLVKVHSLAVGPEPVTGRQFDANDPDSQLWIHLTGWHSVLKTYEMFGPGKLSEAEETQYWNECAVAAELQTCDPAEVPRSRDGIRAYFAEVRPRLAATELTQSTMRHLLDASLILPPDLPRSLNKALWPVAEVLSRATIASMPMYMRELGNIQQSKATDAAATRAMRTAMHTLARSTALQVDVIKAITPSTLPVVEPILRKVAPLKDEILTPAEARARYGVGTPQEQHQAILAKRGARSEALV